MSNRPSAVPRCRYFEEVAIGDELPPVMKLVTHNQLVRYSGASGDFNPIHTDPATAREAGLGGVIAHGLLGMAFLGQLMTDWLGDPGALKHLRCRFSKMVRPGDTVTAKGTVTKKETLEGQNLVTCTIRLENQAGESVITNGLAVCVLLSRQGPFASGEDIVLSRPSPA